MLHTLQQISDLGTDELSAQALGMLSQFRSMGRRAGVDGGARASTSASPRSLAIPDWAEESNLSRPSSPGSDISRPSSPGTSSSPGTDIGAGGATGARGGLARPGRKRKTVRWKPDATLCSIRIFTTEKPMALITDLRKIIAETIYVSPPGMPHSSSTKFHIICIVSIVFCPPRHSSDLFGFLDDGGSWAREHRV
jgi:hypothetical protein